MTWREIAALPRYRGIPPGTLCSIVTQGYIPPKWYHRFGITKNPRRRRIVAQVDEATYQAVKRAAEAEGLSMAEWVRELVEREQVFEED